MKRREPSTILHSLNTAVHCALTLLPHHLHRQLRLGMAHRCSRFGDEDANDRKSFSLMQPVGSGCRLHFDEPTLRTCDGNQAKHLELSKSTSHRQGIRTTIA
jgi:hypothetical protein